MSIENAKIQEFKDAVIHLSQQSDTRVRPHVMEESSSAEYHNWDLLAATDAVERTVTDISQDTTAIADTWTRRVSTPRVFEHTLIYEDYNKAMMAIDPQSAFTENQAMSMARAYDDVVIEACSGDATTNTNNGTLGTIAFPAGNIIGDGTANITFDDVTAIQESFMLTEIMPDMPKVAIVTPHQVRRLLQLTEQTNADFVQREALQRLNASGIVPNWMGFTWIVSNRLVVPGAGEHYCIFMTEEAMGLQVNMEMKVRITENPQKRYQWQVFSQFAAGAVRVEDNHIRLGHFADAIP
jgi:hypothetical protein